MLDFEQPGGIERGTYSIAANAITADAATATAAATSITGHSHVYGSAAMKVAARGPVNGSGSQPGAAGIDSRSAAALAHWLLMSLEHVGRGMLLLSQGSQVLHANRLARSALAAGSHALMVEHGRLSARNPRDDKLLTEAIEAAASKGLRRLLTLGRGAAAVAGSNNAVVTVAVLPIEGQAAGYHCSAGPAHANAVLISLPQPSRGKDLAVQIFAREHGCTSAETAVLEALLAGLAPEAIAQGKRVQLCTVRTQIGQLRLKTGSHTIRELLDRVAALPPMTVVVQ